MIYLFKRIKAWLFPIWEIGGIYTIPRKRGDNPFDKHPHIVYKILEHKDNWYKVQHVNVLGNNFGKIEILHKFWLRHFIEKLN